MVTRTFLRRAGSLACCSMLLGLAGCSVGAVSKEDVATKWMSTNLEQELAISFERDGTVELQNWPASLMCEPFPGEVALIGWDDPQTAYGTWSYEATGGPAYITLLVTGDCPLTFFAYAERYDGVSELRIPLGSLEDLDDDERSIVLTPH